MNCLAFQAGPSLAIAGVRGNQKQVKNPIGSVPRALRESSLESG